MDEIMQWYERDMTLEQAMDGIEINMRASVRNYIAVGFYLKAIRDRKLFQEAGYKNFEAFVRDKYDRDKGWASKCIKVNDQLSRDGNSPILAEEYKEYKVSQLVELAYLTDEQRVLASPDMTVKQLQAIRKPEPQPETEVVILQPEAEEHEEELEEKVVISQQKPKPAQPERTGKCIHRPDLDFECSLAEEYKHIPGNGTNCDRACCWDCTERSKGCRLECYSSERRPEELQKEQGEEPAAVVQQEPEEQIPTEQTPIERGCITGLSRYGNCVCCGYDGVECCAQCDESCNSRCGWLEDEKAESVDKEPELKPEREEDTCDQETPITELQIAQEELERAKRLHKKGLGCGVDENDIHIRRLKTTVCAWASYVCDLDSIVNPPPKPVQPELPPLKNNDQRAAFVDAYETWPLWIETEQTGERYYRYDLEDGTSMVVKVYHARIFDGYTPGSYEAQYHDGYGRQEYYLLQAGKFFRDCETNRSLLIEKLKEIQKLKKG